MSARKKSKKTRCTGKPSARRASKARRPDEKKPPTKQLLDLEAAYHQVLGAYDTLRTAARMLDELPGKEDVIAACSWAHKGAEAFASAIDSLEKTGIQLGQFGDAGGAS